MDEMDILWLQTGEEQRDAVRKVSPLWVAPVAGVFGIPSGWSLDLTACDSEGGRWDFDDAAVRQRCRDLVARSKPLLLIGSPMCTWFSRSGEAQRHEQRQKAASHLKFVFDLYRMQADGGRYYLHEHPLQANRWEEPMVKRFMDDYPEDFIVVTHQCMSGSKAVAASDVGQRSKQPTKWVTNSGSIAERLKVTGDGSQEHVRLTDGRTGPQGHRSRLCEAILLGMRDQLQADRSTRVPEAPPNIVRPDLDILNMDEDAQEETPSVYDEVDLNDLADGEGDWVATDDLKGGELDGSLVQEARAKELKYLWDRHVYEYATVAEARRVSGRSPIGLKWIDSNKGSEAAPNYRSRLVCTEVRQKGVEPIFSATPPLEATRVLLAVAAQEDAHRAADPIRIAVADVSRAHFYADAVRNVYVKLPPEDPRSADPTACGKLLKTMYGSLDAAQRWGEHYALRLEKAGFRRGVASPCHFHHKEMDIRILVHGDDFLIVARSAGREYALKVLREAYELSKVQVLGKEQGQSEQVQFLGRIIRLWEWGYSYETDPAHRDVVVTKLGLAGARGVATPGIQEAGSRIGGRDLSVARRATDWREVPEGLADPDPEDEPLLGDEMRTYQSLAARLNYISMDRPDLLFAVKELMRRMAAPRRRDWAALKRIGRYLISFPRLVCEYRWRALTQEIAVYVDANFAGCDESRKSTVGGAIVWSGQFVKAWSKTMSIIALSSGESELGAVVKGATEGLGVRALLEDFGLVGRVALRSDASAAIGIVHRLGLGKVRHLATADLWVQQRTRQGDLALAKCPGKENPSDAQTKHLGREDLHRCVSAVGWVEMPLKQPASVAGAARSR